MLFAALYVPDFPVQALVRVEPELRPRALAVLEGSPPLLRVAACNQRARQAGVYPGMTKLEAETRLERLPGILRLRSPAQEAGTQAALRDCAWAFSPRIESDAATPHTVVLDLAGLQRLFGPPAELAQALAQRARQLGLEVNVALASNPETAVCAARGFAGITLIAPGAEAERLGTLPVEALLQVDLAASSPTAPHPRGTGAAETREILDTLARWGIRNFRAFAALPETAVAQRLGPAGVHLQMLARGGNMRPLVPAEPVLHFEETAELEFPVALLEPLAFLLNRMLEQLCARLAARALSTQKIGLRLHLCPKEQDIEDGSAPPKDSPILARGRTRVGHLEANGEMDYVLRFPVPMLEVKTFLRLLQLELQAKPPGAPVGKIVLSAEPVAPRFLQGGLFLPVSPEPQKLEVMLARIRNLVSRGAAPGKTPAGTTVTRGAEDKADGNNPEPENVYAGAAELLDTHRPDAFRMRRFPPQQARDGLAGDPAAARGQMGAPAKEPEQKTGNGNAHDTPAGKAGDFSTPSVLRRFRPPQPVKVQVEDGRPKTISYSPLLPGKRGTGAGRATVSWAAGPWRESGEWWTAQPWSREVWDVAVQQEGGAGIYRLYHDAIGDQWFIEAEYD